MGSCPPIPHPFPHSVVLTISAQTAFSSAFLLASAPKGRLMPWDVAWSLWAGLSCFTFLRGYFPFQGLEWVGGMGLDAWVMRGLEEPQLQACFPTYSVGLPAPLLAQTGEGKKVVPAGGTVSW